MGNDVNMGFFFVLVPTVTLVVLSYACHSQKPLYSLPPFDKKVTCWERKVNVESMKYEYRGRRKKRVAASTGAIL